MLRCTVELGLGQLNQSQQRHRDYAREALMGITVVLESEVGAPLERVEDPTNILHRLLPSTRDQNYPCLGTIDWYGDTVFNHLQTDLFLEEWARISAWATAPTDRDLLRTVEKMAERVGRESHLYLKFYGD